MHPAPIRSKIESAHSENETSNNRRESQATRRTMLGLHGAPKRMKS
jgi:hypothetical protein